MRALTLRLLAALGLLWGAGPALAPAFAHAELTISEPAAEALLAAPPDAVTLEFTEAVEVAFSRFGVYRLEIDPEADVDLADGRAFLRLNGLAATLAGDALGRPADDPARLDLGAEAEGSRSKTVTLPLPEGVGPGAYVVAWRVLSVDGHTTGGQIVFVVEDPPAP